MIVDEKGLIKAMKEAYTHGSGYSVAAEVDRGAIENIIIGTGWWTVVIEKKSLPRKVLGLIAEHVGDIPGPEEAYRVMKGEPQTEIYGVATQLLRTVHEGDPPIKLVKRTALTMDGYQLWQRKEDLRMFLIAPELEDILLTQKGTVRIVGDGVLMLDDMESRAYVAAQPQEPEKAEQLAHLSKVAWVV